MEENKRFTPTTPKSNQFTTVTPLSKILALIVFIAFPFVGFVLGIRYQKMVGNSHKVVKSTDNKMVSNVTSKSETTSIINSYEVPNKLIDSLDSTQIVPEQLVETNGDTLTLYKYKEPTKSSYCDDTVDDCKPETVYGNYTEGGFDCYGNPFYNQMNSLINKIGHFYSYDDDGYTVPSIQDHYTKIKFGNYEFFTGSTYEIFLLKDPGNKCHPYKLSIGYLDLTNSPNIRFKVTDPKIAKTNYSGIGYGCGGSTIRLVEQKNTILPILTKIISLDNDINIYAISPEVEFSSEIFTQFVFSHHYTTKEIEYYTPLSIIDSGGISIVEEQKKLLEEIKTNKSVIFVEDPLFPDILFVYISIDNVFLPGC